MLKVVHSGTRVINIDETWLSHTDFRSCKWGVQGSANSKAIKSLAPRISLIVGLSSDGEIYCSVTQVNTDSSMLMMFISRLAAILSKKNHNWRENCVLLLDGASYHKSADTRAYLGSMRIKTVLSAPYSY